MSMRSLAIPDSVEAATAVSSRRLWELCAVSGISLEAELTVARGVATGFLLCRCASANGITHMPRSSSA